MVKCKRILAGILAVLSTFAFGACSGGAFGNDGKDHIIFCTYGNDSELNIYSTMVDEFNKTYGKEHNIEVAHTPKPVTGYASYIESMSTAKNSYDVCLVVEDTFKKYANMGFLAPMSDYFDAITDIDTSDVFQNTVNRLRLNVKNNTSNPTDPLYGFPPSIWGNRGQTRSVQKRYRKIGERNGSQKRLLSQSQSVCERIFMGKTHGKRNYCF